MIAVKYHLDNYSQYSEQVKDFVLEAIWFLLNHNYFSFNGTFYLQKRGTAMGARFAPTYANLYLGWWEETHILGADAPCLEYVVMYRRFIDDLLFVWNGSEGDFNMLLQDLGNVELNLAFTGCFSKSNIVYLDLHIYIEKEGIATTVHTKPSAGNSLLRADSCHPCHFNKGIPRGQFLRLRRNCSSDDNFLKESCKLRDKSTLLKDKKTKKSGRGSQYTQPVTLRTKYSRQFNRIKSIVGKYLPILYADKDFKEILRTGYRIVARRAPTIGSILAPSLFSRASKSKTWLQSVGMFKCNATRYFECSVRHEKYKINEFINCNTKSVVYVLTCRVCYKQYVGCTVRPMKERIREHINTIRSGSEATVVSRHFKMCSHSNVAMLKAQGIERITLDVRGGDLRAKLLRAEVKWIHKLNTRQPQGLNSVFDISCYI
ncbi:hypothetical protein XELAEV_18005337mg [Xenopus laevis]|uniref:GIY-YIG domain-containing protein n=1 Tax=Xenopus laevis TaxID=8355 RepID=A0A974DXV4_XENLA|nr:hypothetical protein XELAEV_18005337mg [Xenopus laevis]